MKILFVCSGNVKGFDVVPFIKEQGEAIRACGLDVEYFPVIGKGVLGYLKNALHLRRHLKQHRYDIIHAHFILSGFVAIMAAGKTPVVLSLMGSDAYGQYVGENKVTLPSRMLTLLTYVLQPFAAALISKSQNIERHVYLKRKSYLIPNGIDTAKFRANGSHYREELSMTAGKKHVLFLGSKASVRKNFSLAQKAVSYLNRNDVELVNPYPVPHQHVPKYLNSADVIAVCSYMEGSPNVVKEAMACNCPIVTTDVGDVRWVIGETEGCFIASFNPEDYAKKLDQALHFAEQRGRTNGEKRIAALGLDSQTVAKRVIEVYNKILKR